jgi:15-cis-phytoene synthase
MKELFDKVSIRCSRVTTTMYSTSFSIGIRCLDKKLRDPIYAIYGFVRFADEIVDTFHAFDKAMLLKRFRTETYLAINDKISLNPILNSFQAAVNRYQINPEVIAQFLESMEMDLTYKDHNQSTYEAYILGSAEAVGLMCLKVFCDRDDATYEKLKPFAMRLGAAFQKINFLRDLNADFTGLGRTYFPGVDLDHFTEDSKRQIEIQIKNDLEEGYKGIRQLPRSARFGVYVAYVYYRALFNKIKNTPSEGVMTQRIRIRNRHKAGLLAYSFVKHQLNMI